MIVLWALWALAFESMGPTAAQSLRGAPPVAGSGCAKFEAEWAKLAASSDPRRLRTFIDSLPATCDSFRARAEGRLTTLNKELEQQRTRAEQQRVDALAANKAAQARSSLVAQVRTADILGQYYPSSFDCWMKTEIFNTYADTPFAYIEAVKGEPKIKITYGVSGGTSQSIEYDVVGSNGDQQLLMSQGGQPPLRLDVRGNALHGFSQNPLLRCDAATLAAEKIRRAAFLQTAASTFVGSYRLDEFAVFQPRNCKNLRIAIDGEYLVYSMDVGQVRDFDNKRSLIMNVEDNIIKVWSVGKYASQTRWITKTGDGVEFDGDNWVRCD